MWSGGVESNEGSSGWSQMRGQVGGSNEGSSGGSQMRGQVGGGESIVGEP